MPSLATPHGFLPAPPCTPISTFPRHHLRDVSSPLLHDNSCNPDRSVPRGPQASSHPPSYPPPFTSSTCRLRLSFYRIINVHPCCRRGDLAPLLFLPSRLSTYCRPLFPPAAGEEIWRQTRGRVHAFVCGAGTGGTIAGVSRALKAHDPRVRVFLVDPPGSSLFNKVGKGVRGSGPTAGRTAYYITYSEIVHAAACRKAHGSCSAVIYWCSTHIS